MKDGYYQFRLTPENRQHIATIARSLGLDPDDWGSKSKAVNFALRATALGLVKEDEMKAYNRQVWVCGKCGRTSDDQHIRGWLIDSHKDAAKQFNGEMVIRCPQHITDYALSIAEHGKAAVR